LRGADQLPLSASTVELDAAILQVAVATGLVAYAGSLYRRYRKSHFAWFAMAWALYLTRLLAIMAFLVTQASGWLYWHQVVTGWTALALLWSALVFSRQLQFRWVYLLAMLFPLGWSYVAIYVMRDFFWAALPAVLFLSFVTVWTGAVFCGTAAHARWWGTIPCRGAPALGDTPSRLSVPAGARSLVAVGYYLDIIFLLATAPG
jgi:hypothetical protein